MDCLVVIDMQVNFEAANLHWLVKKVVAKVKKYRKSNQPILLVQYVNCVGPLGDYVGDIVEALNGYENVYYIDKKYDDGGREIDSFLRKKKLKSQIKRFEVCGVNTDACVLETLISMYSRFRNIPIFVALDCCNSLFGKESAIKSLRRAIKSYGCSSIKLRLNSFRQRRKIAVA